MHTMSQMPYHIGFKVKLYPSDHQKHLIAVNDGAKQAVYNHLVACGNERYRLTKAVAKRMLILDRCESVLFVYHKYRKSRKAIHFPAIFL